MGGEGMGERRRGGGEERGRMGGGEKGGRRLGGRGRTGVEGDRTKEVYKSGQWKKVLSGFTKRTEDSKPWKVVWQTAVTRRENRGGPWRGRATSDLKAEVRV